MTTFKKGDKVKVIHKITEEEGYENNWFSHEMDRYVCNNVTYTISYITDGGVYFMEDFGIYGFPHGSLELAEKIILDGLTPVQRRCKKLWNQSNWVKKYPQQAY